MDSLSDNALMFKVKEGDLEVLGLLFERYKKMLFGFFYRMTFDENLSEDLVQNVFIRILNYRHTFKGHGEFKMWMFHIARNVHHEHFRRNTRLGRREELNYRHERLTDHRDELENLEKDTNLKLLAQALSKLSPDKKEVITLGKIEGFKYKEIAELLKCTESAVKIKVFRALKELRQEFDKIKLQNG